MREINFQIRKHTSFGKILGTTCLTFNVEAPLEPADNKFSVRLINTVETQEAVDLNLSLKNDLQSSSNAEILNAIFSTSYFQTHQAPQISTFSDSAYLFAGHNSDQFIGELKKSSSKSSAAYYECICELRYSYNSAMSRSEQQSLCITKHSDYGWYRYFFLGGSQDQELYSNELYPENYKDKAILFHQIVQKIKENTSSFGRLNQYGITNEEATLIQPADPSPSPSFSENPGIPKAQGTVGNLTSDNNLIEKESTFKLTANTAEGGLGVTSFTLGLVFTALAITTILSTSFGIAGFLLLAVGGVLAIDSAYSAYCNKTCFFGEVRDFAMEHFGNAATIG